MKLEISIQLFFETFHEKQKSAKNSSQETTIQHDFARNHLTSQMTLTVFSDLVETRVFFTPKVMIVTFTKFENQFLGHRKALFFWNQFLELSDKGLEGYKGLKFAP